MAIDAAVLEDLHPIPSHCPVCSRSMHVERLRCGGCGSAVEGRFGADWPSRLTREQLAFVQVFMRCGGKIKDVEQALGVSYPTVVSRLDEVIAAISPEPLRVPAAPRSRREVLDALSRGELDAAAAERLLRKEKP